MRLPLNAWMIVKWAGEKITNIARDCGEAWIFRSYAAAEVAWCEQTFRECSAKA
jgi:hypothetical protein